LPPVSAQNRNELAVRLLAVDADDDCLSSQRVVTLSASAAVPVIPLPAEVRRHAPHAPGYLICAIGNSNPDFWIRD